jgi:hypothetical protein
MQMTPKTRICDPTPTPEGLGEYDARKRLPKDASKYDLTGVDQTTYDKAYEGNRQPPIVSQ